MNKDIEWVLYSEEDIKEVCQRLGEQISKDYEGKKVTLIGLLKGSVPFMADLMKYITIDIKIDFMDVSSYEGTESTGSVKIIKDLDGSIVGDNILIIEDIVDTGRTLQAVSELLFAKGAADVKIATLLNKKERRVFDDIKVDYYGFLVPNEFVVGYGLDYNQYYRNLPYIGVLKKEIYSK